MQKPTKVLLIGLALAAVLALAGAGADFYADKALASVFAPCEAQGLFCWDGEDAAFATRDSAQEIAIALYVIAMTIAILAAIPWTWYFLLRRLREVRDALTGR